MNVESFSSAWRKTLSCEGCSTRLNVFRKKKTCYFCKNSFCQVCITRREDKNFCCRKCQILTARPLDKSKLLNLRSRDLINYLTSRQIPTNGCVEKEDLVNVLIRAANNSYHYSSAASVESSPSTNSTSNSFRSTLNPTACISHVEYLHNDGIRVVGYNIIETEVREDEASDFDADVSLNEPAIETEQCADFGESQRNEVLDIVPENRNISATSHTASSLDFYDEDVELNSESLPLNEPLKLSDIKDRSDLDSLSVKQLKELLIRNRTDFKGCVERDELIQKVFRLWSDYTVSRKDLENLSLDELCKICMDAPIECVLLECGHMATCTSCGKQLCECPICRQFVVRCVRTFKA